ncbi:MAG: hypothetical protein AB8H86_32205 [Polyangiales bacterium]
MEQNGQSNGSVMALMGCGVLLMCGLCVVTGMGAYMFLSPGAAPAAPVVVAPATPANPNVPAQPQQPPIPQPFQPPQPQQPTLPPPPPSARANVRVRATVTHVTAGGPVASGAQCDFQVEQPTQGQSMCRAQVYCGGRLLYGGPNAGFFQCTPGPGNQITGQDGNTTADDTDASFAISTPASIITIRDDASGPNGAFTLTARVDSVQ